MSVGAELHTLQELHKTFDNNSQAALDIKKAVNDSVGASVWTGTYADEFRNAWDDYQKNLDVLGDALAKARDDVRTNHNNIAAATGEPDRL